MGRINWLDKFPQPTEKKTGPRNWDACWKIVSIRGDRADGVRMTGYPYRTMPWFPLIPGTIKIFAEGLVIIEKANSCEFSGQLFLGVAVYDEREL